MCSCCSFMTSGISEVQLPKLTVLYSCSAQDTLKCKISIRTPFPLLYLLQALQFLLLLRNNTLETQLYFALLDSWEQRGTTASATFSVVKKGTVLLGRDLMAALNICIKGNTILLLTPASPSPVMTTNSATDSCIPAAPDSAVYIK